jgi:uncharacterized protein (TIGR02145 family)
MVYWDGSAWVLVPTTTFEGAFLQMIGGIPTWTNGTSYPLGSVFGPSGPTPVVEVIGAGGRIWMDRNLGATQRATSATDANSYGDLYQWGRGADGHQLRNSATTTILSGSNQPGNGNFILVPTLPGDWRNPKNDNLWQGINGINNPCPRGFRIPTIAEWEEESSKWSTQSAEGAYDSPLRLPRTGWRHSETNTLSEIGSHGVYWSSTLSSEFSRSMNIRTNFKSVGGSRRAHGFAVRCIKDY